MLKKKKKEKNQTNKKIQCKLPQQKRQFYYINTNEIPSELSRENMISSHVKRSLLLWLDIKIAPFDDLLEMI